MKVKIDTREKFTIITLESDEFSVNLTEELFKVITAISSSEKPNIILNLKDVKDADNAALKALFDMQQKFYEEKHSFVLCGLQPHVSQKLEELDSLDMMNITPTESEAYDIVQMEEIERELFRNDEAHYNEK